MDKSRDLDPHKSAPQVIKDVYKTYRKLSLENILDDPNIIDFRDARKCIQHGRVSMCAIVPREHHATPAPDVSSSPDDRYSYQISGLPGKSWSGHSGRTNADRHKGLLVLPQVIPLQDQAKLLSILLHDNLANPRHKTNVHIHHSLPYHACCKTETQSSNPQANPATSFFHISPDSSEPFLPVNEKTHKTFTVSQFLSSKLRWMTLGAQYDWTAKMYPLEDAPAFPQNIASLIHRLFPKVKPEAAILNIYKPGDSLNMHRDVSEQSDNALVSISIGCDGIFMVSLLSENDSEPRWAIIRLRSGDAIYMGGPARFAWHGLPQVIANTCPDTLREWPAAYYGQGSLNDSFEAWRGWLANKRINLSVRQIHD
ncbi:MAG: hypothetical protein Q9163_000798 [Psora crenata]